MQAAIFGSGCWATSHDVNEVGVACCTSGLLDFVCYFIFRSKGSFLLFTTERYPSNKVEFATRALILYLFY